MAWASPKPCAQQGCGALVKRAERFCPEHRRASWRDRTARVRSTIEGRALSAFYSSRRWIALRLSYLARYPLCVLCKVEGRITAATVVDHIIAMKDGGAAWDESNLQALCASHHDSKSARESAGRCTGVGQKSNGNPR